MNLKINKQKVLNSLMAIEAFCSINPFIFWETYSNYFIFDILKKIIEILICIDFFIIREKHITKRNIFVVFSFIIVFLYYSFNNYGDIFSISLGFIMKLLLIAIFLIQEDENKIKILDKFVKMFGISLIPSILFCLLNLLNIDLKFDIIKSTSAIKNLYNQHYKHYFGCVFRENIYYSPRFKQICGMFDEPGLVGTISALILCVYDFKFHKNKILYVILTAGILSMSLAFILLVLIYISLKIILVRKAKNILKIFFAAIICFVVLFLLRNNAIIQEKIISRLSISYLMNNNRTSDEFDIIYDEYLKTGKIFFGNGNNNPIFDTIDASSYKILIYNFGIVGFILVVGWFLFWGIKLSRNKRDNICLVLIFMLSIYQRPWIMYMYFILLYFAGIAKKLKEEKINS